MSVAFDHEALLSGFRWNNPYPVGTPTLVTYSFATERQAGLPSQQAYRVKDVSSFDPVFRDVARDAFGKFEDASALTFIEVPANTPAMIQLYAVSGSKYAGWANYPMSFIDYTGTAEIVIDDSTGAGPRSKYVMDTMVHEIGHAVGLKHPFEGPIKLYEPIDTLDQTVMSYTYGDKPDQGTLRKLDKAAVKELYGSGNDADDWSFKAMSKGVKIVGDQGRDVMLGVMGQNVIFGRQGNDVIAGREDDDILKGGKGSDWLIGGYGEDRLVGMSGRDRLFGGDDDDLLLGGSQNDRLSGDMGDDRLIGGRGYDVLMGNNGTDRLSGGDGRDRLFGGDADDLLWGGDQSDYLVGGRGDDALNGGLGKDVLRGGEGADGLSGGRGTDTLKGGSGDDRLVVNHGNDKLWGGAGADEFVFAKALSGAKVKIHDFSPLQDQMIFKGADPTEDLIYRDRGDDTLVIFEDRDLRVRLYDVSLDDLSIEIL